MEKELIEIVNGILGEGYSSRDGNYALRHTTVEMKSTKIGWTIHRSKNEILITTMMLHGRPPYKRDVHVKTFDKNEPNLKRNVANWAIKLRGY